MIRKEDAEGYIAQYPQTKKWLNQCIICQTVGYKPEMPQKIGIGIFAETIRSYFNELELNEMGICKECSQFINNKNSTL
jgi:hypothetical protein